MVMLEQMVETKYWKQVRGLIDDGNCRVCFQHSETVEHLIVGCQNLANSEYLSRHNRAWAMEHELIGQDVVWYEQRNCSRNDKAKLVWDFEVHLRKNEKTGFSTGNEA